jgi:Regulator of chromosome condensation (RCC1) repeat
MQVAAGYDHTVGLKSSGTVAAVGDNDCGQCNVGYWTGVSQVAAGNYHTVGLKSDDTVVAVGDDYSGQCDVGSWANIIQVAAGRFRTVGLEDDGIVIATSLVTHWNLLLALPPLRSPPPPPEPPPSGGGCFIATAAYGTPMAEEIQILREFRDEYLLTNPLGQALVGLYYRISPPIAEFITEHPSLKPIVRVVLAPVVAFSAVVVNSAPAERIAIVGLAVLVSVMLAVWIIGWRRGRPRNT